MDQRVRFVSEHLKAYFPITDLCAQFEISRKTGYKWLRRYKEFGAAGLVDRSRKPLHCPHKTEQDVIVDMLRERKKHPSWGPKKLLHVLSERHRSSALPAISTAADILKRNGLILPGKRRLRRQHPGCPMSTTKGPNDIWTADYKGQFKTRNGRYCYPLTVCDMHSRFLLGTDVHDTVSLVNTKKHFTELFHEYGLPKRIRTDNGVPFASSAIARLSTLSAWWIKLGIYPEQIEPGMPQQNGKHERMHRTMKKEATIPPEKNLVVQQERFDRFRAEYNDTRPHEALGMKTPAAVYRPSERRMPKKLGHFDYPSHFEVRLVSDNGGIRWLTNWVYVTSTLALEYVGFEEMEEGVFDVYFCDFRVGRFFEKENKIMDLIARVPTRLRASKHQNL